MELVVFGAGGFVGRNLLAELAETDHSVTACDIVSIENRPKDISYEQVDITDDSRVDDVIAESNGIIHLAAHQLPASLDHPKKNAEVNILGTLNVLDSARKHDVEKVFFPSASSILGSVDGLAADEDIPPAPRSPYGVAKHAVEEYLEVYNDLYGIEYLVFRFFNVYGPYQYPESGAFIPVVMSRLANGDGVYVTGDGQQTRDFVYVRDVSDMIVEGMERGDIANEIVNMGYGSRIALLDAIHTIADVVGVDPDIERRPERDDEIDDFCADTSKCERLFGRKPETQFEEGVKSTYRWMREDSEIAVE